MRKRIASLVLLVLLTSLLPGCWDRYDVSDLAIVGGVGVDRVSSGRIRMTLQIALPSAFYGGQGGNGGQSTAASWVVSGEGKTVADAEAALEKVVPRKIFWDSCGILVVGDQMAGQGIGSVTDFFLRHGSTRETMLVMITKGEARTFLETSSVLERMSSQATQILDKINVGYSIQLWKFAEMLDSKGIEPVVPWVSIQKAGVVPEPGKGQSQVEQPVLSGMAVFRGDKVIGWLNTRETRALLWLKGKETQGAITVPSPDGSGPGTSVKIRGGSAQIIPEYDGRSLRFQVNLDMNADVMEQTKNEAPVQAGTIKTLDTRTAQVIKQRVTEVLHKAQRDYGVDIFGFGQAFHRSYKKDWREMKDRWDEDFTGADVNIAVEAHVHEIGLISQGAGRSKND